MASPALAKQSWVLLSQSLCCIFKSVTMVAIPSNPKKVSRLYGLKILQSSLQY
nr:MAG TPA: hypothetical protein [Caudoviricetes sp.]